MSQPGVEKLDLHSHDVAADKIKELLRLFREIRTWLLGLVASLALLRLLKSTCQ
jgi:hypothetical protein